MRTQHQRRRSRRSPLHLEQLEDRCVPSRYALTDLGNLGGAQSAQAYNINEAGHVVGYATAAAGPQRAFLWQDGVMTDLGTLGGSASLANALNNVGQVVGHSRIAPGSFATDVFLWEGGVMVGLGIGTGTAYGINDAGQVVGIYNSTRAFLWHDGVFTDLGSLGSAAGGGAFANDINNAGQVVGSSYTHAFLWQDGVMTDLGVLPGMEDSGASAINSSGQIVGSSGRMDPETYEVTSQAFLYSGGVMTALPVPSIEGYAGDINNAGQVVGTMRAGGGSNYHAYIYSDGVVTNLNSLIPAGSGLHLITATAINNAGQIVGYAYDARGRYHAFLLTPDGGSGASPAGLADSSLALAATPPAQNASVAGNLEPVVQRSELVEGRLSRPEAEVSSPNPAGPDAADYLFGFAVPQELVAALSDTLALNFLEHEDAYGASPAGIVLTGAD